MIEFEITQSEVVQQKQTLNYKSFDGLVSHMRIRHIRTDFNW
jgi:hypothetical protein